MRGALLDTHTFLWALDDYSQLTPGAKEHFLDSNRSLFLSQASVWEMAIKISLGRLKIRAPLMDFILDETSANKIRILEVSLAHCHTVSSLPFHHKDPFDRMLAAQTQVEDLELISADVIFDLYEVRRVW